MPSRIKVSPLLLSTIFVNELSGEHHFSWAVMPHEGHFLDSDVPMAGYLYNSPLRREFSFLSVFVFGVLTCRYKSVVFHLVPLTH